MRGYLIVTHGPLASAIKSSVEMIVGEITSAQTVELEHSDGLDVLREKIEKAFQKIEHCDEVFVLVDLLGGSPSSTAFATLVDRSNVNFLSGVNFPMLLTLVLTPEISVAEIIRVSRDGILDIRQYIRDMSQDED